MTSSVVMERAGIGMLGMGMSSMMQGGMGGTATMPAGPQWMMMPRCTMKMEKCKGGMKITCKCDDKMTATMMQNLCTMLAGGMCSCCMMMMCAAGCTCCLCMNNMPVCCGC